MPVEVKEKMIRILTEQSIGKLFMTGIIPGALQVLLYSATVAVWDRFRTGALTRLRSLGN